MIVSLGEGKFTIFVPHGVHDGGNPFCKSLRPECADEKNGNQHSSRGKEHQTQTPFLLNPETGQVFLHKKDKGLEGDGGAGGKKTNGHAGNQQKLPFADSFSQLPEQASEN